MDAKGFNDRELARDRLKQVGDLVKEQWCDVDEASWEQLLGQMKGVGDGSEEEKKLREIGAVIKAAIKGKIVEGMRIS